MSTQTAVLVQIPAGWMSALHDTLGEAHGEAEAAHLLRRVGIASGAAFLGLFHDWLSETGGQFTDPAELDAPTFWASLSGFFEELGWGSLEVDHPHPGIIALTSQNWVEATGVQRPQPGCHCSTGLLAELFRSITGSDLAVLEVECRGAGAGSCRFLVGGAEALEKVFGQLRDGAAPDAAIQALS